MTMWKTYVENGGLKHLESKEMKCFYVTFRCPMKFRSPETKGSMVVIDDDAEEAIAEAKGLVMPKIRGTFDWQVQEIDINKRGIMDSDIFLEECR